MAIDVTSQLLASGHKYRQELLAMPFLMLKEYLQYMTLRVNIRGKESVGTIGNNAELRPYRTEKGSTDTTTIAMRELETFLGDVVEEMDPHLILSTIYGNAVGKDTKDFDIVKAIAMEMAKVVGEKLRDNLFTAKRDSSGLKTADLFNGFSTIISNEITASKIAVAEGNLKMLSVIDSTNAVDALKDYYRSACEHLKTQKVNMLLPHAVYESYLDDFQATYGMTPLNSGFEQTKLIGSNGKCTLVPLSGLSEQGHLIISPKTNLLVGCDQMSDTETVRIRECDNPKLVQFFMKLFFGVEFESIDKKRLLVGKIQTT